MPTLYKKVRNISSSCWVLYFFEYRHSNIICHENRSTYNYILKNTDISKYAGYQDIDPDNRLIIWYEIKK
jgi:hypothetical protein